MKINWKVRINNKMFWLAIIPMAFLLAQQILAVFGIDIDFTNIQEKIIAIVGTVFAILGVLGVVVDPTTDGIGDTKLSQTYTTPRKDVE